MPACAKFDLFYDIPYEKYYKRINEAERKIITKKQEVNVKGKAQPPKQATEQPTTVSGLLNAFRNRGKDTKTKTEAAAAKTAEKSKPAPAPEAAFVPKDKNMKKYLDYFSLPAEVQNTIFDELSVNDVGRLADFAESEKSVNVSTFARGWITTK